MDNNALLGMINSTIDKIYSAAGRYNIKLSISKEDLKDQVGQAALKDKSPQISWDDVFSRLIGEQLDKKQELLAFKAEMVSSLKNLVSILNRYGSKINSKEVIRTIATMKIDEEGNVNSLGKVPSGSLTSGSKSKILKDKALDKKAPVVGAVQNVPLADKLLDITDREFKG